MAREKFRVTQDTKRAKDVVCIGRTEMKRRKAEAKRHYRRRSKQILDQVDPATAEEVDILDTKPELTKWSIA